MTMITKNTRKHFLALIGLTVFFVVYSHVYFYGTKNKTPQVFIDEKLRICPDEWIDNQMPIVINSDSLPRQYFILNSERMEMSEFDIVWVFDNCALKVQMVF